jgi:hypothetical protein
VTSVGLALPAIFTVTGTPVTGAGVLTATLVNQSANTVFAGPSTGAAAPPAFRALVAQDLPANQGIGSFGASFDGGGQVLVLNTVRYTRVPFACTVTGWSVIGDTGTFTVDVLRIASGTVLPTSSIAGSALPALATGNALKSTTLTGWNTAIAQDDLIGFKVTAVSGTTTAQVLVECNKT